MSADGLKTPTKKRRVESNETPNKRKINMTKASDEYFEFKEEREIDGVMKRFYTCTICKKELNCTSNSNKTSHLSMHKDVIAQIRFSEESIERKRLKLILDCVEMVAVNGRSFTHLFDSALHSMIADKLDELKSAGQQINLNDPGLPEIKECLRKMAEKAKKKIADEIVDRPLSLLCDIVTKRGRSLFGFSLQYIANGKHRIRSIGMVHLTSSHTGQYLASLIANRLSEYGVEKDQLLTVTTDNGANMIKMIKDIREMKFSIGQSENTANAQEPV